MDAGRLHFRLAAFQVTFGVAEALAIAEARARSPV
jgi:hypothetical protein